MSGDLLSSLRRPTIRSRGFSLIEVLVAVTIVGIAAGMSIPKIAQMQNQAKVQRATYALQLDVQQAWALAGRNRAPIRLAWNSATLQVQVTNLAGSVVYRRTSLGPGAYGLSSSEVSMTPNPLVVFPGGLAADTLVFQVTRNAYTKRLRVSKSGMVRLQ